MKLKAFVYLRISTKTNLKGDGFRRQKQSIADYCKDQKIKLVQLHQECWTGTDADRPEFNKLLANCNDTGIKTIVIESADRLARDLMVQLQLLAICKKAGIKVIAANTSMDLTDDSDPMRKTIYSVMGAMAEYEKTALVMKLAKARNALSKARGKRIEGRKKAVYPIALVERIKNLRGKKRRIGSRSFKEIANILNKEGMKTVSGKEFLPSTIHSIISQ